MDEIEENDFQRAFRIIEDKSNVPVGILKYCDVPTKRKLRQVSTFFNEYIDRKHYNMKELRMKYTPTSLELDDGDRFNVQFQAMRDGTMCVINKNPKFKEGITPFDSAKQLIERIWIEGDITIDLLTVEYIGELIKSPKCETDIIRSPQHRAIDMKFREMFDELSEDQESPLRVNNVLFRHCKAKFINRLLKAIQPNLGSIRLFPIKNHEDLFFNGNAVFDNDCWKQTKRVHCKFPMHVGHLVGFAHLEYAVVPVNDYAHVSAQEKENYMTRFKEALLKNTKLRKIIIFSRPGMFSEFMTHMFRNNNTGAIKYPKISKKYLRFSYPERKTLTIYGPCYVENSEDEKTFVEEQRLTFPECFPKDEDYSDDSDEEKERQDNNESDDQDNDEDNEEESDEDSDDENSDDEQSVKKEETKKVEQIKVDTNTPLEMPCLHIKYDKNMIELSDGLQLSVVFHVMKKGLVRLLNNEASYIGKAKDLYKTFKEFVQELLLDKVVTIGTLNFEYLGEYCPYGFRMDTYQNDETMMEILQMFTNSQSDPNKLLVADTVSIKTSNTDTMNKVLKMMEPNTSYFKLNTAPCGDHFLRRCHNWKLTKQIICDFVVPSLAQFANFELAAVRRQSVDYEEYTELLTALLKNQMLKKIVIHFSRKQDHMAIKKHFQSKHAVNHTSKYPGDPPNTLLKIAFNPFSIDFIGPCYDEKSAKERDFGEELRTFVEEETDDGENPETDSDDSEVSETDSDDGEDPETESDDSEDYEIDSDDSENSDEE